MAFLGIATMYLWPDKRWIGWLCLLFAVALLLYWPWREFGIQATNLYQKHPVISTVAAFICGGCIASGLWFLIARPNSVPTRPPLSGSTSEQVPTLTDLFKSDFPNVLKVADDTFSLKSGTDGTILPINRQVYMDFEAKTQFVGFYIPFRPSSHPNQSFDASMTLVNAVQATIEVLDKHVPAGGDAGGITKAQDLIFSGRVYLYHEEPVSNLQKAEITQAYHARHYDVNFRGLDYLGTQVIAWRQLHDAHNNSPVVQPIPNANAPKDTQVIKSRPSESIQHPAPKAQVSKEPPNTTTESYGTKDSAHVDVQHVGTKDGVGITINGNISQGSGSIAQVGTGNTAVIAPSDWNMKPDEQNTLLNALAIPTGQIKILPLVGDPGSVRFAGQLAYAFDKAGWMIKRDRDLGNVCFGGPGWDCFGVQIHVHSRDGKQASTAIAALSYLNPYVVVEQERADDLIQVDIGKYR